VRIEKWRGELLSFREELPAVGRKVERPKILQGDTGFCRCASEKQEPVSLGVIGEVIIKPVRGEIALLYLCPSNA
jgi:hypothetical protein